MFDHVALGIVLPGPLTRKEKWHRTIYQRKARVRSRWPDAISDFHLSQYLVSADFDDPPSFSWMQPEMPHTWGPDQ